jgi:hypothetical protein
MRYSVVAISLLITFFLKAQENYPANKLPVFKQVTHPFMPPITSEYFFFSEDGLIWFSTAQGLTSFDGSEITYYSSLREANSYGLNRILTMAEDKNKNFYLGTPVSLFYYDRKTKTFTAIPYTFSDNHASSNISFDALYYDINGILYAGSALHGLFIYDEHSKQFSHYNLSPAEPDSWQDQWLNTVSSFANHATDSNKLWVGTFHGIYLFDKQERKFNQNFEIATNITHKYNPRFQADKQFIDVAHMDVANDSIIWFNSWAGGFANYNVRTGKANIVFGRDALYKKKDIYYGYIIAKFVPLSDSTYLLGIYNGKTAIFNTRTGAVVYFNVTEKNYPQEETRFVTNDRQGNTWLLQRGFLYAAVPENLRLLSLEVPNLTPVSFSKPKIRGIYYDSSSKLFYGAFLSSSGVHVYDSNFLQQTVIPTSIINNFYNYGSSVDNRITKDGSGRFWTVGWKNHVMLAGEKKFSPIEKKLPSLAWLGAEGAFNDIATTRNGNILVKRDNGIIYHIDHVTLTADTIRCPEIKTEGVEVNDASAWYDNKRDLVYLTRKEGIAQFNLGKREMRILPYLSLFGNLVPNQGVCAPALDAEGRIWFMIPKYGIRIIDPVSLLCVDSIQFGNKGLIGGDYTSITGGSGHYILFRSQNGIVIYDFVKQQSFLFDHSNGLSGPDTKSFSYSNGYMIIGQSSRIEYFRLSNLDNYSSTITPYLNTIIADTSTVFTRRGSGESQTIKLPYYQNTLTFSFSAPEFFFPERIEYAYQLTPLANDWHTTNYFNRKISFTKLAPGKYIFRLKAQMQGGTWNIRPIEYTIIITPAWWQTDWFKLLCIIAAVTLVIYLVHRRIQFIRKAERQKSKHEKELLELEAKALRAQMNPHFIFNCLNSIKSLIQQNENEKSVTYLTTFSKLIRTLLNNADKKEITLYGEIETCKYYLQLEAMRFDTKFSYTVNIDEAIDLKSVQVPALIIQPFIENAIWHGIVPHDRGGNVSLNVIQENSIIEIIIDDDGVGRETSQQNKSASGLAHQSKGVNLTQSRLELNNLLQLRKAKLEIIDKKDENGTALGTTVIIKIKEEQS